MILDEMLNIFKVEASEPASNIQAINSLKEFSQIIIPNDYFEIINIMTAVEISINKCCIFRIWSPEDCIDMNDGYHIQEDIPKSLAIGDDEGGAALIYMTGKKGFGLYKVSFGYLDVDGAEFISHSITNMLTKGDGVSVICHTL